MLILSILILYFALLLVIARLTGKNAGNDAFFRGNRNSKWYIVAFGMVGSSISGVTFISVPGMIRDIDMSYMQTVMGFSIGYLVIAFVLLPLYYKLNLTSIYTYLGKRFGNNAYKTGAWFFLFSRITISAVRIYIVVVILQACFFDQYNIPFFITTSILVGLIWAYTFKSGIKTIVWTDVVQTLFLLMALILIIWQTASALNLDFSGVIHTVKNSEHTHIFVFDDWQSKQYFFKQFISGIFITIVMTGLDQDMMQKNLTCRNLKDAQKNMCWYGFAFIPINFLFLCLGVLLLVFSAQTGLQLPGSGDGILPMIATEGYLGAGVLILFMLGITAASFSSADSALTALTTSFCIDILNTEKYTPERSKKIRMQVHLWISVVFILIIYLFKVSDSRSIIDALYVVVSYTYGPLLGLFAFGLFTKTLVKDNLVPYICIASPIICLIINQSAHYFNYSFGYELLMLNGFITMTGLWCIRKKQPFYGNKNSRICNQ